MGNIIDRSCKAMVATKPDAVLVLDDTNFCLSVPPATPGAESAWRAAPVRFDPDLTARRQTCRR